MVTIYYSLTTALSYYAIFLAVFGTLGNVIVVIVCTRSSLRKNPTFNFLIPIALFDTIPLYIANFNSYFIQKYGSNVFDMNLYFCKIFIFTQMLSQESSAFLMVNKNYSYYVVTKLKYSCLIKGRAYN